MNIVIMESLGISQEELNAHKKPFEQMGCTFRCYEKTNDIPKLIEQTKDAEAMILANMPLPAEVINACPNLKFIDIAFTGVDHVAMDAVRARNIVVSNASGYSNQSVAELGVGMVLALLRNIPQVEKRCRDGMTKDGLVGYELKGKTVGIIGLGKIGRKSAELYNAFGCRILANSRSVHADCPDYIQQVSREELLKQSDIVVLHCPLNESTRGMINSVALGMMKKTALLVNLARGPVVVAKDLMDALNNDVIAGAGIDVFDREPPLDADEPLLNAKNTIVTPHIAFATKESMSL
ncbi:MAG: hydroxyacid dehydrogenase, partial [Clostridiaceae bacterium]|nr:hydroxyacid dehydrogenase [Clostridiaceae bacterium]